MLEQVELCIIGNENSIESNADTPPWLRVHKDKFTVAIEGNIGSGKSTFLNYFSKTNSVEVLVGNSAFLSP